MLPEILEKQPEQLLHEAVNEKDTQKRDEKYNQYIEQITPTHNLWKNIERFFGQFGNVTKSTITASV